MPMYVASTTKTRRHSYPATVDIYIYIYSIDNATPIDVYFRVANVIIIFIINNTYNC